MEANEESVANSDGPMCPHCGYQYIPDEEYYYDEANFTSMTCDGCNKTFNVQVEHETTWTTTLAKVTQGEG